MEFRQENQMNPISTGKEKVELPLLTSDNILYLENPKEPATNL